MANAYNISAQLPDHIVAEYPLFVDFLQSYYAFMSESGNPDNIISDILSYRDVDTTIDSFKTHILNEFMQDIPINILVDKALLAKHIKELYIAKGSEDSYRLLFRILFDSEIDMYYPVEQILKSSDGKWEQNISFICHISKNYWVSDVLSAIGEKIVVTIGDKTSPVSVLDVVQISSTDVDNNLFEFFIKKDFYDDFDQATTFVFNTIDTVSVISGGVGYVDGDTVSISTINGGGANITISTAGGIITAAHVLDGGFGFVDAPVLNVDSVLGRRGYLSPNIIPVFSGTILPSIHKPTIVRSAGGYIEGKVYPIRNTLVGLDGYIQIKRVMDGLVRNVTISAFGEYYPTELNFVINRLDSIPEATAVLTNGSITSIVINRGGYGYGTADSRAWFSGTDMPAAILYNTTSLLNDGRILVAGGVSGTAVLPDVRLGIIAGHVITWASGTAIPVGMVKHKAVVLPDDRILLMGGYDATTGDTSPLVYFGTIAGNVITWAAGTDIPYTTLDFAATILHDGRIMLCGGASGSTIYDTVYFGTIAGNVITWASGTVMPVGMVSHHLNMLNDHRVVSMGGYDATTGEISPLSYIGTISGNTVAWVATNNLPVTAVHSSSALLTDGRILLTGGATGSEVIASVYIGTVNGNTTEWGADLDLINAVVNHTSIVTSANIAIVLGGNVGISGEISQSVEFSSVFDSGVSIVAVSGNGRGADVSAITTHGIVTGFIINSGGYGYTVPPALIFSDTSVALNIKSSNLRKYNGIYLSTEGFTSADMAIYDGQYYQKYSYEIVINQLFDSYKGVLKKLLHPVGYGAWGVYDVQKTLYAGISTTKISLERNSTFRETVFALAQLIKNISKSVTAETVTADQSAYWMLFNMNITPEITTATESLAKNIIRNIISESTTATEGLVKTIARDIISDTVSATTEDINTAYVDLNYGSSDYFSTPELKLSVDKPMVSEVVTATESITIT